MSDQKVVSFKDVASKYDTRKIDDNKYLSVNDVLNKEIEITRFDWETTYDNKAILLIYSNYGIIKSGSAVLQKQAKQIERDITGQILKATIVQRKSQKPPFKSYYTFS